MLAYHTTRQPEEIVPVRLKRPQLQWCQQGECVSLVPYVCTCSEVPENLGISPAKVYRVCAVNEIQPVAILRSEDCHNQPSSKASWLLWSCNSSNTHPRAAVYATVFAAAVAPHEVYGRRYARQVGEIKAVADVRKLVMIAPDGVYVR